MKHLNRRSLLRGGAAIALSLPALQLFREQRGMAQEGNVPKRLIVIFHGNGIRSEDWYPDTTGTSYDLKEGLKPLAAFQDRMIVTHGIHNESAKDQGGNPHTKSAPHLLTGVRHIDGQFTKGGGGGFATDISFDQALAAEIRGNTPIPSLLMGPKADEGAVGETPRARISYSGRNQPLTPEHRPQALFDRIVMHTDDGGEIDPAAEAEAALIRKQRKSVLDFVGGEVSSLQTRLGTEDKARLEEYLTHLREMEEQIQVDRPTDGSGPTCSPPDGLDPIGNVKDDSNVPAVTRQMLTMTKFALECDITRVAAFQWAGSQSSINYSRINDPILNGVSNGNHHGISHDGPFGDITKIAKWHSQQVADFCTSLDSVDEGNGTLLDNSVILYCNELSDGDRHDFNNLPFVLIGGAGGALKSGRSIKFGGKSNNDLFLALFQAFGINRSTFGDPKYTNGPLTDILA